MLAAFSLLWDKFKPKLEVLHDRSVALLSLSFQKKKSFPIVTMSRENEYKSLPFAVLVLFFLRTPQTSNSAKQLRNCDMACNLENSRQLLSCLFYKERT
jgi:hypothetical protein